MTLRPCVSIVLSLALTAASLVEATPKPVELRWSELEGAVKDQTVEFTTKEGVTLRGDVLSVRPDALVMNARRTSNAKLFPKGGATVPRASIQTLRIIKVKSSWGRNLGVTTGVIAGLGLGGYAAAKSNQSGGTSLAIALVLTGVVSFAGYALGKQADTRTTVIQIIP